jgi:hypothetical protein
MKTISIEFDDGHIENPPYDDVQINEHGVVVIEKWEGSVFHTLYPWHRIECVVETEE